MLYYRATEPFRRHGARQSRQILINPTILRCQKETIRWWHGYLWLGFGGIEMLLLSYQHIFSEIDQYERNTVNDFKKWQSNIYYIG